MIVNIPYTNKYMHTIIGKKRCWLKCINRKRYDAMKIILEYIIKCVAALFPGSNLI